MLPQPRRSISTRFMLLCSSTRSIPTTRAKREDQYRTLRYTLGSVVVLFSPFSARSLSRLLHKQEVSQTLEDLLAILDIAEDQTRPLRLHHPSFRYFLLDRDRCGDSKLWVDEKQAHRTLADNCVRLMANSLKQDICSLDTYGVLVTNIDSSRV
ncbi:hypothetical protein K469DRAFT_766328 [Zopfia rhizophila CBS 207.26]|uniref:Uncharacterized protein n=1 Tax=Zopfia rhizophila CBS 207.26 TaxID=1314779 RepID=A0A6A6EAX8_9PEZI|nr:hypothetical protein K469DRAFT_766328 [Zopfia rhizophila CBS 207.26]